MNGRKGRRVIVVLGSDRKHYRVLDMDFRQKVVKEGMEGESSSEDEDEDGNEGGDIEMGGA